MAKSADKPQNNELFLDDQGVIHHILRGHQTAGSIIAMGEANQPVVAKLRAEGKRVAILVDLSEVKSTDSATRNQAKAFLETDFDAVAVVGNRYLRPLVEYVLHETGKNEKVRYFTKPARALSWLRNPDTGTRRPNQVAARLRRISVSGWVIIVVFMLVGFSAYNSWQQGKERLDTQAQTNFDKELASVHESVNDRVQAYVDALIGFRGLFYASNAVTEQDFATYFESLDTLNRYPGIESINYERRVIDAEGKDHYIQTYVGVPGNTAPKGTDRSLDPVRLAAYNAARDDGAPMASHTATLHNANGSEKREAGFVISIPIYGHSVPTTVSQRRAQLTGFVTGIFNYDNFFKAVFGKANGALSLRVFDENNLVFSQGNQTSIDVSLTNQQPLSIAGHAWSLDTRVPTDFGLTATEQRQIRTTIASAIVVATLLVMLFWQQVRARSRTLKLADAMTEDLQNERNEAIANKNKDEAILSSIGDGVFVLDEASKIILFNKKAEQLSGYTASEVLGKPYNEVLKFGTHDDPTAQHDGFIARALSGSPAQMEHGTILTRKDGVVLSVADSAAPVFDADGGQRGVIVVFRDVTQQEQLDQAKDEFISIVSHQLRTPLTAMRLFVEMLVNKQVGPLNEKQMDYTKKIQVSTARMIRLVGDILNVSRIELGRVRIVPEPTDANALILSYLEELKPLAEAKKVTIKFEPDSKLDKVNLDPAVFGQIVHNLVGNAIRYTKEGQGEVQIRFSKQPSDGYVLAVSDNGIGIPAEAQAHIFERFYRAENAIAVEGEGTGLGLYLVKLILDSVGGRVRFESHNGKGTAFYATLPATGMKAKQGEKTLN